MAQVEVRILNWLDIRSHLKEKLDMLTNQIINASDERELWVMVGRARQLRELMNLQETLTNILQRL